MPIPDYQTLMRLIQAQFLVVDLVQTDKDIQASKLYDIN